MVREGGDLHNLLLTPYAVTVTLAASDVLEASCPPAVESLKARDPPSQVPGTLVEASFSTSRDGISGLQDLRGSGLQSS